MKKTFTILIGSSLMPCPAYTYRQKNDLPKKVKRKGYTFLGWYLSAKNDWEIFQKYIPEILCPDFKIYRAVFLRQ